MIGIRVGFLGVKVLKKKKKEEDEKKKKKKGAKEPVKTASKREKKVYDLPGQKRDPPEEVKVCFFSPYVYFSGNTVALMVSPFICRGTP